MSSSKFLRFYREIDKSLPSSKVPDLTYQKEREEILAYLQPSPSCHAYFNGPDYKPTIQQYTAKPLKYHGKLARIRNTSISSKTSNTPILPNNNNSTSRRTTSASTKTRPKSASTPSSSSASTSAMAAHKQINQLLFRNDANKAILQELQTYINTQQTIPKQVIRKLVINEHRMSSLDEKYQHERYFQQHQALLKGTIKVEQAPSSSSSSDTRKKKSKSSSNTDCNNITDVTAVTKEGETNLETTPQQTSSAHHNYNHANSSSSVNNNTATTTTAKLDSTEDSQPRPKPKPTSSTSPITSTLPPIMQPNPHVLSISTSNLHLEPDGPSSRSPFKFTTNTYSPTEIHPIDTTKDHHSKFKWTKAEREYMMALFHELPLPSTFFNAANLPRNVVTKQLQLSSNHVELWKLYFDTFTERFCLLFPQHRKEDVLQKAQEMIRKKQYKACGEEEYWDALQGCKEGVEKKMKKKKKKEAVTFTKYDIYN